MNEPQPRWEGYQEVERINGVDQHLGQMTLEQLLDLEAECAERVEDARHERSVVEHYREQMYPESGVEAEVVSAVGRHSMGDLIPIELGRWRREDRAKGYLR